MPYFAFNYSIKLFNIPKTLITCFFINLFSYQKNQKPDSYYNEYRQDCLNNLENVTQPQNGEAIFLVYILKLNYKQQGKIINFIKYLAKICKNFISSFVLQGVVLLEYHCV